MTDDPETFEFLRALLGTPEPEDHEPDDSTDDLTRITRALFAHTEETP